MSKRDDTIDTLIAAGIIVSIGVGVYKILKYFSDTNLAVPRPKPAKGWMSNNVMSFIQKENLPNIDGPGRKHPTNIPKLYQEKNIFRGMRILYL